MTFDGFTSRCSNPASCTAPSASPTRSVASSTSSTASGSARADTTWWSERPSTSSITRYAVSFASVTSKTRTMPGWLKRASAAASRRNRARAATNASRSRGSTSTRCSWRTAAGGKSSLTATVRPSRSSCAR